ncbi:MAG: ankyrin repeat domain-containing protein [Holosporaceae bacterium]|jgi:ankyrin repeat protein|nr:ankyrin repeat domain-containing protein [Holosporaceae bacterium]
MLNGKKYLILSILLGLCNPVVAVNETILANTFPNVALNNESWKGALINIAIMNTETAYDAANELNYLRETFSSPDAVKAAVLNNIKDFNPFALEPSVSDIETVGIIMGYKKLEKIDNALYNQLAQIFSNPILFRREYYTPLLVALEKKNITVAEALIEINAEINTATKATGTPLCLAIERGIPIIAQRLIDKGADINAGNPLCLAIEEEMYDVARYLIDKDVDVKAGEPVRLAVEKGADINAGNPLCIAIKKKSNVGSRVD